MAQKIEQGLGRAVRGEKDYCVVLVLGEDLVDFVGNNKNREFQSSSVVQIFPTEVTNSLSLLPNEYRYARSYFFEISK